MTNLQQQVTGMFNDEISALHKIYYIGTYTYWQIGTSQISQNLAKKRHIFVDDRIKQDAKLWQKLTFI